MFLGRPPPAWSWSRAGAAPATRDEATTSRIATARLTDSLAAPTTRPGSPPSPPRANDRLARAPPPPPPPARGPPNRAPAPPPPPPPGGRQPPPRGANSPGPRRPPPRPRPAGTAL